MENVLEKFEQVYRSFLKVEKDKDLRKLMIRMMAIADQARLAARDGDENMTIKLMEQNRLSMIEMFKIFVARGETPPFQIPE
jgi:hypothetical protein